MIFQLYTLLLIALGGAIGAVCRFSVTAFSQLLFGSGWPYGTLIANVSGSFLIGVIATLTTHRFDVVTEQQLSALIITGFLGAFTTFSSFSLETFNLFQRGHIVLAGLNVVLNLSLCLSAVCLGCVLVK